MKIEDINMRKRLIAATFIAAFLLNNVNADTDTSYEVGDTGPTGGLILSESYMGSPVEAAEFDTASEDSYVTRWQKGVKLSWFDAMGRFWALSETHNWRLPTESEIKTLRRLEVEEGLVTNMEHSMYWTGDNLLNFEGEWKCKAFYFKTEEELNGQSDVVFYPASNSPKVRIRLVRNII